MSEKICPVYKKCGGCQLQNLSYPEQLVYKQNKVKRFLSGFVKPEKIIGMKNPYHYRNKVQAAFATDSRGRIISGVYQSNSHRIVHVDQCLIEDMQADTIIVDIRNLLRRFHLDTYDERRERGFLRHVLVKRGFSTGEIMVVLVTATPVFPGKNNFIKVLRSLHPEITTMVQNINGGYTSLVLGEREKVLFGKGYIEDILCGLRFKISPKSFYQINSVQTEILYSKAIGYADLTGKEKILDAYCGIGTIGLIASKMAEEVIGVELNADAVRDAKANARLNGIANARFIEGDAGVFMTTMAQNQGSPDVVFMDPPRAGSSPEFLNALLTVQPEKIIYISCNPETMARDLRLLIREYQVLKLQPVDMFPFTNHVECVALLVHR